MGALLDSLERRSIQKRGVEEECVGDDGMSLKCRNQQDSESYQRALQTYVSAGRGEFSS